MISTGSRFGFLKIIWFFLSKRERWKFVAIALLMLLSAIINMAGIGSIMPFVAILSDPDIVLKEGIINQVYVYLGEPEIQRFLFISGTMVLVLFVLGNLLQVAILWLNLRFVCGFDRNLRIRLFSCYLRQSYMFFLNRNTSELSKNIFSDVPGATSVLANSASLMVNSLTAAGSLIVIVIVNPIVALLVGGTVGGIYLMVAWILKSYLQQAGKTLVDATREAYHTVHEAFGGIKDIKLRGKEQVYIDRLRPPLTRLLFANVGVEFSPVVARPFIEIIVMGAFLLLVLVLFARTGTVASFLPLISLYAIAIYRLLPALQNVYASVSVVRGRIASLNLLYQDIRDAESGREAEAPSISNPQLNFKDKLELAAVDFRYPSGMNNVLENVNISIPHNSVIGFVGSTGCGKTTVVDIILGLLPPSKGEVLVDGIPLDRNTMPVWRLKLGYVPQTIYLVDDTVTRNIAFGVPDGKIDIAAVHCAASTSNIADFIEKELPNGYDTVVGERGIRLSGGQRQRIGIARALYHKPEVLVLDEATSALDTVTEKAIMEAVDSLHGNVTIIIIAHRLTTVKCCDNIFVMEKGRIIDQGKYDELLERSQTFKTFTG